MGAVPVSFQASPSAFIRIPLPASLAEDPDPRQPKEWRSLELVTLRSQAAIPEQVAWFSFNPRPADSRVIKALLAGKSVAPYK